MAIKTAHHHHKIQKGSISSSDRGGQRNSNINRLCTILFVTFILSYIICTYYYVWGVSSLQQQYTVSPYKQLHAIQITSGDDEFKTGAGDKAHLNGSTKRVGEGIKVKESNSPEEQLLFYRPSNADKFAAIFVSCQLDPSCRIMYHHVKKSGGTLMASRLFPILHENSAGVNTGKRYDSTKWCCNDRMMARFRERPEYYCGLKFGIYEMYGEQFSEVVRTCRQNHSVSGSYVIKKRTQGGILHTFRKQKKTREVAFITIREPIQRTISQIHQRCNSNYKLGTLTPEEQAICDKCDYNNGGNESRHYFDNILTETNDLFMGIAQTAIPSILEQFGGVQSHLLILDSAYIDTFSNNIEIQSGRSFPRGVFNNSEGPLTHCNFAMSSSLMRELKPALDVYRNMTIGEETFGL